MSDSRPPKLNSIYGGVVFDNKDPMKLGRVKLKIGVLGKAFSTEWAWPVSPMSGVASGFFCPPAVEATVFCMFLEGDSEHPVYIGGVWSAPGGVSEVPEEFQRAEPTNRGFKTPGGHLLEFDDEIQSMGVRFGTIGGHTLIFDDREGSEGIFLVHNKGSMIQMTSKGSIIASALDGAAVLTLDAETKVAALQSALGAAIALTDKMVFADKSGKSSVSITETGVQVLGESVVVGAQSVSINAGSVNLGSNAVLSVTAAEPLAALFDGHLHMTALGPSGPPMPPLTAALMNANPATAFAISYVKIRTNLA